MTEAALDELANLSWIPDEPATPPVPALPPEVWHQAPAAAPDYMKAIRDLCRGAG